MDDSFNLARNVARFVSLLKRQPNAIDQQKLQLRTLVVLTKEGTVRLSTREGQLVANGLAVPAVLAGVRDLADQMIGHRVDSVEINQGMAAGELLAIGRILAEPASEDWHAVHERIRALDARTVTVQLRAEEAPRPHTAEHAVAEAEPSPGTPERVRFLLARVNRDPDTSGVGAAFDEVAFAVEQATREGRTTAAMDAFVQLIRNERDATDAEVRRHFVLAIRRLTKPAVLHPIARLLIGDATRTAEVADAEVIITRCGTDGVDALVDQYASATTGAERAALHVALDRLPSADAALTAMLSDARAHVVRTAAGLMATRRTPDGDRALAEQIGNSDVRVRRAIVRALGAFETPFALDALVRALADPIVEVRLEAVAALANRRGAKVGDIIGRAIDTEEEPEVQVGLIGALGRIATPDAVAKLAKAAEAGSGLFAAKKGAALRLAAVRALAEARTATAISALKTLVNDKEREVRDAATRAIGR